jgi:hypothetical protein
MPGNYDGRPGQITTESLLTVTGASNTNPIAITVSGSLPAEFFLAGYGGNPAGPLVDIFGVQGNTAANGLWTATPTGVSTFTIPVAGNGAYTTGGNAQPLYLKSMYTLPVDGDADNSASIATWGQGGADRAQWLATRTGILKLAGRIVLQNAFGPNRGALSIAAAALTAGTWNQLTCTNALTVLGEEEGVLSPGLIGTGGSPAVYSFDNFQPSDIAQLESDLVVSANDSGYFAFWWATKLPGAANPTWPGSYTLIPATARLVTSSAPCQYHCQGLLPHLIIGELWISPAFYALNTNTYSVSVNDHLQLVVDAMRITEMPQ